MAKLHIPKLLCRWWCSSQASLSPNHLRGGWIHWLLGDRLFRPELWQPSQRGIAGGLALGLFIGLTPTMGVQVILSAAAAYLLRVNLPIALAATLITNPFTAAIIYPLEYQVGLWLVGIAHPHDFEEYSSAFQSFSRHGRPLFAGALALASLGASAGYTVVSILWRHQIISSPPKS